MLAASILALAYFKVYYPLGLISMGFTFKSIAGITFRKINVRWATYAYTVMIISHPEYWFDSQTGFDDCTCLWDTSYHGVYVFGREGGEDGTDDVFQSVVDGCDYELSIRHTDGLPWLPRESPANHNALIPLSGHSSCLCMIANPAKIAMAYRFDYSQSPSHQAIGLRSDKAIIPRTIAPFSKPLFSVAMITMITGVLVLHLIPHLTKVTENLDYIIVGSYINTPLVLITTSLAAWLSGKWDAWWGYKEV